MKSVQNIVFLGMMGSGKSSIGEMISKKLRLDFFDIDKCVEKKLDLNISQIFRNKGEKYFRKIEEEITLSTLKKKNIVISLGGGGFMNIKIRDEILKNHISFWLHLDQETIIKRIKNNSKRPIAFSSTNNELISLIKKRSKVYSKAMYTIDCNNLTKNEITKKILSIYETN